MSTSSRLTTAILATSPCLVRADGSSRLGRVRWQPGPQSRRSRQVQRTAALSPKRSANRSVLTERRFTTYRLNLSVMSRRGIECPRCQLGGGRENRQRGSFINDGQSRSNRRLNGNTGTTLSVAIWITPQKKVIHFPLTSYSLYLKLIGREYYETFCCCYRIRRSCYRCIR